MSVEQSNIEEMVRAAAEKLRQDEIEANRQIYVVCLTCYKNTIAAPKGSKPSPGLRCDDCRKATNVFDPDYSVSKRLGLFGGQSQFVPGVAATLGGVLRVPLESLLDPEAVSLETLAAAYDQKRNEFGGPPRRRLPQEIAIAAAIQKSDELRRTRVRLAKTKSDLEALISSTTAKLESTTSELDQIEKEIAAEEQRTV